MICPRGRLDFNEIMSLQAVKELNLKWQVRQRSLLETHLRHAIIEVISNGLSLNGRVVLSFCVAHVLFLLICHFVHSCKICQMISQHAIFGNVHQPRGLKNTPGPPICYLLFKYFSVCQKVIRNITKKKQWLFSCLGTHTPTAWACHSSPKLCQIKY